MTPSAFAPEKRRSDQSQVSQKRPIRILLWCPPGAGKHYDGTGMNAYRLYAHADAKDVAVDLAHGFPGQEEQAPFRKTHFISDLSSKGPVSLLKFLIRSQRWLRANMSGYDIFHGINAFEETVQPAHWAASLGAATFVSPQNHGYGFAPARGLKRLLGLPERRRKLARGFDGVIAISNAIRDELLSYQFEERKVVSIPNGIDRTRFRPAMPGERNSIRTELGWSTSETVLLFVGGLCERKRPEWLLHIADRAGKMGHRIQTVFVGPELEQGQTAQLRMLAEKCPHVPPPRFYGHTEHVETFFRAADMFCLPSKNEGMPVAMLESMASGLITFVCRVSGATDVIRTGENGFLIDSPDDAAAHIRHLLENTSARNSICSAARTDSAGFSVEATWGRHHSLFIKSVQGKTISASGK